jgi:O-antigen/teichoic acid export membrane protein
VRPKHRRISKIERLGTQGRIFLSTSSQTFASALTALLGVAILKIVTRTLGPAEYGEFALIVIYVNLFSTFADIGITSMTLRDMARSGADRPSILSVTLSSRVALSIIAIPIINGTAALLYPDASGLFRTSLAIMSLDILFATLRALAGVAFLVRVRGDVLALMNVSAGALSLVGIALTTVLHGSYLGYVCSYVGADFVVGAAALFSAHRSIALRWNADLRAWWRAMASAFPLGSIQVAGTIYSWIDSILLSVFKSSVELSYYTIAFNIINLLITVPGFLMQSLLPSLVNAETAGIERLLNRAVYVLFCVAAPLATGGIVLRDDIILVISGPKFLPASIPLLILLCTVPITFVQNALGYTSVAIDRYKPLLGVVLGTLVINVGLNLLFIPPFGPSGAAWALLVTEGLSVVATYFVFRHLSGIRVRWISLWRPAIASCVVFCLLPVQGPLWSHQNRFVALLVGGSLVTVTYVIALLIVRGTPGDVRGSHRRKFRLARRRQLISR